MKPTEQEDQNNYVSTLKRVVFIPAVVTTIVGMLMVIDFYLPRTVSEETLVRTGKNDVYITQEGHRFLSGYYTYYAFNDNEVCRIYHTPIFHVVTEVADNFEGQWDKYLLWHFYVGNAVYAHILFLFSFFIVLKRKFNTGVYYVAYLLLLFIGFLLYLMLWP